MTSTIVFFNLENLDENMTLNEMVQEYDLLLCRAVYTTYLIVRRHKRSIKTTRMASPQLWAISVSLACPEPPRVSQWHFDWFKGLSCAAGKPG